MKKEISKRLTPAQRAEIDTLAGLGEETINTSDIPEVKNWKGARRGLFFRPIKMQITLRLDADIIAWFKDNVPRGEGYQTNINRALREYIERHAPNS